MVRGDAHQVFAARRGVKLGLRLAEIGLRCRKVLARRGQKLLHRGVAISLQGRERVPVLVDAALVKLHIARRVDAGVARLQAIEL